MLFLRKLLLEVVILRKNEFKQKQYAFWNGKNLDGTQEYFHVTSQDQDEKAQCVVSTETVAADDHK